MSGDPGTGQNLYIIDQYKPSISNLKFGNFNRRMVNDLKATDHHGLLITTKILSALSAKAKAIYDMIAYRLLESLSEHCSKEVSHITIKVHHYEFSINGSEIQTKGWRGIRGILSDQNSNNRNDDSNSNSHNIEETLIDLPELKIGG